MRFMKRLFGGIALAALVASNGLAVKGKALVHGTAEGSMISGTALLEDTDKGLKVSIQVDNVPPGVHGLHIHEFGDCGDMGKAAGSHYNPEGKKHGHVVKEGLERAHAGDLGNITINDQGMGTIEAVIPGVSLTQGQYTVGGRAIILHEKADDFGQPVGNAGGRIGCGPILVVGQ